MDLPVVALPSLESLREHVRSVLCEHDRLDPNQSELRMAVVCRGGSACGLFFQVIGIHRQKGYALWAGDEHRLLFYDATGQRYAETVLSESPDPLALQRDAA